MRCGTRGAISAEVTVEKGGKQLDLQRRRAAVEGEHIKMRALTSNTKNGFLQERECTA